MNKFKFRIERCVMRDGKQVNLWYGELIIPAYDEHLALDAASILLNEDMGELKLWKKLTKGEELQLHWSGKKCLFHKGRMKEKK